MSNIKKATFGAGCFWGVESYFSKLPGVIKTAAGYMGGNKENPTYEEVCSDKTGHAEVIYLEFNPDKISYVELVIHFFKMHDPTQVNRQGPDVGTQYRSAIFYYDDNQKQIAVEVKEELESSDKYNDYIATEITPAKSFWKAEDYHQKYLEKKGLTSCSI
ncbi:MAG: peptide-methionine (S)-S-oxide reductase MsrA [Candidatus Muiribacteriota bacterium]